MKLLTVVVWAEAWFSLLHQPVPFRNDPRSKLAFAHNHLQLRPRDSSCFPTSFFLFSFHRLGLSLPREQDFICHHLLVVPHSPTINLLPLTMASPAIPRKRRRASSADSGANQFASEQLAVLPKPIKLNPGSHIATEDIRFILSYLPLDTVIDMFTSVVSDNQPQAWKIAERFNDFIIPRKIECARNGDVEGFETLPGPFVRSASLSHLSAAIVSSMLFHLPPFTVADMFASVIPSDQSLGWTIARRFNGHVIRRKWELTKLVEDKAARGMPETPARKTVSIYRGRDLYIIDVQDVVDRLNSPSWNGNDSTREFSDEEMEWITKYVLPLGVCQDKRE